MCVRVCDRERERERGEEHENCQRKISLQPNMQHVVTRLVGHPLYNSVMDCLEIPCACERRMRERERMRWPVKVHEKENERVRV